MRFVRFVGLLTVAMALVSCSPDPTRILGRGNRYYDRGKYKEAALMYRQALRADAKYGEGYYHLGLASLKLQQVANALNAFRRAIELLPVNTQDQTDASIKYAEILLVGAPNMKADEQARTLEEVRGISDRVLEHYPNRFEAQRLLAQLTLNDALVLQNKGKVEESREKVKSVVEIYRKSLTLKPGDSGVMVAMGETLLMLGDVDEAERTYRKALDQDRTALAPYLQLYKLYVSKQRMDDAETILRRAIATHPDNYGLQVQLAAHFVATKNRWEMAKALDSLKTHFKEYPDAFNRAGEFYAQLGDNDRAIREYQEGMTRDSLHKLDYQKRVIDALMRKGDNASAFEKNREILKANAKDVDARALDANFLLEKGQTDAAIAELRAVVASKPDNFVSLSILGRAYYAKKELGLSAQQFEEVLKVRPDYMPARLALAQIALLRHDPDTALTWAQTGLKMDPRSADSAFLEASAYADKGELDKARPLLETLVKDNPRKADPLAALASLEMREKRYKEAEELFRRAYEAEPSNLRGLLGMAEVYARQNDPAGAVQVIAAEVKKQPRRPDLVRALADVEMKNRQYDKAIADYQSVVDQYRAAPLEEAQIIERMGESYEIKGDLQKSLDSYRRARQLAPSNTLYIRRIADLLDRQGKSEEAVAAYRDAMKIDPTNAIVMNNLAFAISRSGQNLDEALTLAQRAKQQLPNLDDASDTIGWIYVRKNLSDSAVEIFRNLTAKVKNNSTYHYHYGVALAQKGDKANALKELRVALQNNPTKSEEAQIKELVQKLS